jgi:hypothetical protein
MVTSPTISLIDDGAARLDLRARRELKYVFAHYDVAALRSVLRQVCRPIVHAGPVSTVRSVYFDGIGLRHKTRLRWYDLARPSDRFFLEVKWRMHRLTGKHRLELASGAPLPDLSFIDLHDAVRRSLNGSLDPTWPLHTEPVVLVEYRREHFALHDGSARLTLDYDLRFCGLLGCGRYHRRFGESLPGVALIEHKAAADQRCRLPGALGRLCARADRFSKYVAGCQRLGYIRHC